jgi:hypothetical protein
LRWGAEEGGIWSSSTLCMKVEGNGGGGVKGSIRWNERKWGGEEIGGLFLVRPLLNEGEKSEWKKTDPKLNERKLDEGKVLYRLS